jgi:hypothetical protein
MRFQVRKALNDPSPLSNSLKVCIINANEKGDSAFEYGACAGDAWWFMIMPALLLATVFG